MKKRFLLGGLVVLGILSSLVSCKNNNGGEEPDPQNVPEWYYTGGKLGTTENLTSMTFRQPTPATDEAGLSTQFAQGD